MSSEQEKSNGSGMGSKNLLPTSSENPVSESNMYLHPNIELSSEGSFSSFTSVTLGMMNFCLIWC